MSYLTFEPMAAPRGHLTKRWRVCSVGRLGHVSWYAPWRRYVFWPSAGALFDAACLRELAQFCEEQTADRKSERAQ